jgi:hypothetical protein
MTTRRFRLGIAAGGVALFAALGTGCADFIDFNDRNLQQPPRAEERPAEEARMCSAVVPEATPAYEAMCRHYCGELEETLRFADLAAGRTSGPAGAVAESCYELRCAPRCVSVDTCVQQCHAVGAHYQALCAGVEIAPDTVCPVPVQDRVDACLAGCGVPVPPRPEEPPPGIGNEA